MTGIIGQVMTYLPRAVTQYGVESVNGWPAKVYGLAVEGTPAADLLIGARQTARATLPGTSPLAAFVIAHHARPACFVLVCWWTTEVDLSQRYFRSPLESPTRLTPLPASSVGCVWELALIAHERSSWVKHLLATEDPDLVAYLNEPAPKTV